MIANESIASLPVNAPHVIANTGGGAAASADVVVTFSGFNNKSTGSFGVCVLGNGNSGTGIGITIKLVPGQDSSLKGVNVASGACQAGASEFSEGTATLVRKLACLWHRRRWHKTCANPGTFF